MSVKYKGTINATATARFSKERANKAAHVVKDEVLTQKQQIRWRKQKTAGDEVMRSVLREKVFHFIFSWFSTHQEASCPVSSWAATTQTPRSGAQSPSAPEATMTPCWLGSRRSWT